MDYHDFHVIYNLKITFLKILNDFWRFYLHILELKMWFDFYPAYLYRLIEVFDTGIKLFLTCVKVILDIKTTFFFKDDLFV